MMSTLEEAIDSFPFFVHNIFSQSTEILKGGRFVGGDYITDISQWYQDNDYTVRVSARDHFKSMAFYSRIMWKILRMSVERQSKEIQYFSYGGKMASYHTAKIKQAVKCNPWFENVVDMKSIADGIISYTWNGKQRLTVTPRGLLEFKRGVHSSEIYVDDPFADPEHKIIPVKIQKINMVMKTQILDMAQDELHICGTPQTNQDFFFDKGFTSRFAVRITPAIVNEATKQVLWEEWMDWDELQAKRLERGEKIFNQEYLCRPVYTEEQFLTEERLRSCVNKNLINYQLNTPLLVEKDKKGNKILFDVVAGLDVGKKRHPSHFVVFRRVDKTYKQLHSKWMDGWDYIAQIDYIQKAIEHFEIDVCKYDGTRGEFESMEESGDLPAEMEGVSFTSKGKHSMATQLDKMVTNKTVEFLNEERQLTQMLMVDNNLQAPETSEGHADSFWSICLALAEADTEGESGIEIHEEDVEIPID